MNLVGKRIILIMSGSVAIYKSLELIRRMRERGAVVVPILTSAAQKFITPMMVSALSNSRVYTDLFLRNDCDGNHIQLTENCDLFVVAPASANFIARTAHGMVNDLASAVLLAKGNQPVLLAPAMNFMMWSNVTVQRNVELLRGDGYHFIGPENGAMAEDNGSGIGRMSEPPDIIMRVQLLLNDRKYLPLKGRRAVVTSGPTYEPLDPMRYITNRSSGRQGHAIAEKLAYLGAEVILISGPVSIPNPSNVVTIRIEKAEEMLQEVLKALPVDIAVMVSAVSDWKCAEISKTKIKQKKLEGDSMRLDLVENPDILKIIGHHQCRPSIVIGFAAETHGLVKYAREKLLDKGADFIVANSISPESGFIEKDYNQVSIISSEGVKQWPQLLKTEVAYKLCMLIAHHLDSRTDVV
ncbi:MAG: bifunctional phosphopantothenoylcysteine decarboxylase/phosphopantothenate--cysteine ligase CoaBC [Candidatus Liberibacter ctenarytainae]|uniref:Coenzyme A biosynthesis bifunctional protein CoaBC n=1 Tax=Candidatus Liberibacter ctenarytainae TaxID=2020335 RepID=A0A937ARW3_9HYPH|nr:bifunctional phosphopantothenoylcysteine decarboxylase/phosphopantothenate--cysteine ligase CoaBC [Candidatus Liberibacter ctenarytainae]